MTTASTQTKERGYQPLSYFVEQLKSQRDTPTMTEWLPYREYDSEKELYINTSSIGFAYIVEPLAGANDELVENLNAILCDLPDGDSWDYQFTMMGTHQVEEVLQANKKAACLRGGINQVLAEKEYQFAQYATKKGFPSKLGDEYRYDLKNYRCAIFVSQRGHDEKEVLRVKNVLKTKLSTAGLYFVPMPPKAFITHISQTLNFNPHEMTLAQREYNELVPINEQILAEFSEHLALPQSLKYRAGLGDHNVEGVMVTYSLSKLPSEFRMYGFPEALASLDDSKSLKCPFRISCNVHIHDKAQSRLSNGKKIKSLQKWANSPMGMMMPNAREELAEREHIEHGFERDTLKISGMLYYV